MGTVSVNPPRTPVTEGSDGKAPATLPNICKMPGPPAPFVPAPLPNVGTSGDKLNKATKKVFIEGKKIAIKGSYFMSTGDLPSKPQGGGLISGQTHGKTEWVAPGSMDTKAEGKNIQLLGDAMTNNGGSPANSGTLPGEVQSTATAIPTAEEKLQEIACKCDKQVKAHKQSTCIELGNKKHECCEKELAQHKNSGKPPRLRGERGYDTRSSPPQRLHTTRMKIEQQISRDVREGGMFAGASERTLGGIIWSKLRRKLRGTCWPDACTLDDQGNPSQFFDFKFQCPAGTRIRRKRGGGWVLSGGTTSTDWGKGQREKYEALSRALGIDPRQHPPTIISSELCP
ncbi:uncharacterized protein DUF4150 [Archangium gephyra]|uniref:Uncharacterized protein DUF4150 n=1 Tax=Archangium gephyra TaxID=48 RepID=A0ABX9K031_9BACT|nr:PAAR-like domain-containing protein [Archangium gephyra]REG30758.1 uncharacterized protein DUF4150 [Archangium gephyra]